MIYNYRYQVELYNDHDDFLLTKVKQWLSGLPVVPVSTENSAKSVKRRLTFSPMEKVS